MQSWREEHEILSFWKFFEIICEAIPQVIVYWEYFANYGTYHSITSLFSNVHSMIMLFISLFKLARAWRHMCKEQLPTHVQAEKFPKNHLKKLSKNSQKCILDTHEIFKLIDWNAAFLSFQCRVSLLVHMKLAIKLKRNNMKVFLFEDSCLFFIVQSQKHAMRVKDIAC